MDGIRIAAIADLHIGNSRIDHHTMYTNLCKYFYPEVVKSHICVIAGDFFDTLQYLNSEAVAYGFRLVSDLLAISDKYGVQIRLLHGTYSHDRNQISTFGALLRTKNGNEFLNKLPSLGRMRIINTIESEEITDLCANGIPLTGGIKITYLPDSLPYKKGEEVISHITEMNRLLGWDKVDMVVGHGTFSFMMPDNVPLPPCTYEIDMFNDVVHGPIVMGHIHTHGRRSNVYYTGSFERISHGEEEEKGFIVLDYQDDKWYTKFHPNHGTVKFVSITPEGDNHEVIVEDFIRKVHDKIPTLHGYVRVLHHDADIRAILARVALSKFPNIIYVSKTTATAQKVELKSMDDFMVATSDDVIPTESNLDKLVFNYINERPHLSTDIKDLTQNDISRLLNE